MDAHTYKFIEENIKPSVQDRFYTSLNYAVTRWHSDAPETYIRDLIATNTKADALAALYTIIAFGILESIAFYKLAPLGVDPFQFLKYKHEFKYVATNFGGGERIDDNNDQYLYGCFIEFFPTLYACEALLKKGKSFEDAMREVRDTKRCPQSEWRLISIANPVASAFDPAQINLYEAMVSSESFGWFRLRFEEIAALKVAPDCDGKKLLAVLIDLLMTKHMEWEKVVSLVNGRDLRTQKTDLFGAKQGVPNKKFIEEHLYAQIGQAPQENMAHTL